MEICYLTTVIELSPDFSVPTDKLEEAISLLSDPVANGPLTKELVREILDSVDDECDGD
jgi:hypothetical protein